MDSIATCNESLEKSSRTTSSILMATYETGIECESDVCPWLDCIETLFSDRKVNANDHEDSDISDTSQAAVDGGDRATLRQSVGFLDLPGELRNKIYKLVLADNVISQCKRCNNRNRGLHSAVVHCIFKCDIASANEKTVPGVIWLNRDKHNCVEIWQNISRDVVRHPRRDHQNKDGDTAQDRPGPLTLQLPSLTGVSNKLVRREALSILFGDHRVFFTYFDKLDERSIMEQLRRMGKTAAGELGRLPIVFRGQADKKYLKKKVLPKMKEAGVRPGSIELLRLNYPQCNCESCILQTLSEAHPEDCMGLSTWS